MHFVSPLLPSGTRVRVPGGPPKVWDMASQIEVEALERVIISLAKARGELEARTRRDAVIDAVLRDTDEPFTCARCDESATRVHVSDGFLFYFCAPHAPAGCVSLYSTDVVP